MSDFQNEDGEFLMTAAELRFEAELDHQSAMEQWEDRFYDNEPPVCGNCGEDGHNADECEDEPYEPDLWNEDAGMEYGLWGSEA